MSNHKVVALARKTSNIEHLSNLGIKVRYGDVTNLRCFDTLKGLVNSRVYDSDDADMDIYFRPLPLE